MKKNFTLRCAALALCLAGVSGMCAAQDEIPTVPDRVFINDFAINPGESQLLEVWLESTVSWDLMYAKFELPAGLEMAAIDPEELPGGYTFVPVTQSPKGYENMVAMSMNFCNQEFWIPAQVKAHEEHPETYSEYGAYMGYSPAPGFMIFSELGDFTFTGTNTIALLKVRATEELAEDAVMTMTESLFMTPKGASIGSGGSGEKIQVMGQPTVARIKRRPNHTAVTDVKVAGTQGDGVYYNLMGQPVSHPTSGIYIHNGQKVVVK